MTSIEKQTIVQWVRNCCDLNPDKGIMTAVQDAADFHDIDITEEEKESLTLEIVMFG